jgi:hypothetical protein
MRLMLAFSVLFLACVVEGQTGGKSANADDSELKSTGGGEVRDLLAVSL